VYLNLLTKKLHVGEIFCDLVQTLDFVNHEILLSELYFYGIRGVSKDWFWSYGTKRRQKVGVKSPNTTKIFFPKWGTLKHEVPQGHQLFIICLQVLHPRCVLCK
jgi:hypothetical protein